MAIDIGGNTCTVMAELFCMGHVQGSWNSLEPVEACLYIARWMDIGCNACTVITELFTRAMCRDLGIPEIMFQLDCIQV